MPLTPPRAVLTRFVRPLAVILAAGLAGCASAPPALPPAASRPAPPPDAIPLSDVTPAAETFTDEDLAHLGYVLTDAEAARYLAAPPEERAEMMPVVWAARDPTPTTDRNERKEAHYRRLAYAREHFASSRPPGWDRRGELLIRYGSPQVRSVSIGSIEMGQRAIPPGEFWIYATLGLAFRLEDPLQHGEFVDAVDWIPGNIPGPGNGPIDLGMTMSDGGGPAVEAEIAGNRIGGMTDRGRVALREDTESYVHDHGGARLDFVFDVLDFASDEPGKTAVEVNFLLDAGDVRYRKDGDRFVADLDVSVVAKSADYREIARAEHALRAGHAPHEVPEFVLDRARVDLPPGDCRLAVQVRDRTSGNIGIYTTTTTVRAFPPGELSLSDLQLALRVERTASAHRLAKGDRLVVPNPSGQAAAVATAHVYFEIYGLTPSVTGTAGYALALSVRSNAGGDERVFAATSYEGRTKGATARESIELDLAALAPGTWEIDVEVRDLLTDRTARQTRLLQVVEARAAPAPPGSREAPAAAAAGSSGP